MFTRGNAKHCFVRALRAATLRTRDLNYLRLVSGLYRGAPRYPLSGWKARRDKTKVGEQMLSYSTKRNYWYQTGAGIPLTGEDFLPFGRKNRPIEKMSAAFPAASSTSLMPRNV